MAENQQQGPMIQIQGQQGQSEMVEEVQQQEEVPFEQGDYMNQYQEQEQQQEEIYQYQLEVNRIKSVNNAQYDLRDLTNKILEQARKIDQISNLGFDWAIMLFYACGWRTQLCQEFILGGNEKHKTLIGYDQKFDIAQVQVGTGECVICGQDQISILKNVCGHQFCYYCWNQHLLERLKTQFRDPFPPCMYQDCPLKMSYKLCENLANKNPQAKKKFEEVLGRSYATYNKSVKVCKGKPGFSCNKCFTIQKMMDFIQCNTCGNFICPRCGQQFHGSCECFLLTNWRRLTEDSTQFIQQLGYKTCPYCKEVVQRKQGCNSMICKCKQQFCYVCGQKWLPNHKSHGDQTCPKFKQIQILNEQKKKRKENSKQYFQTIQSKKAKLDSYYKQSQRIQKIKKQKLKQIIKCFLDNLKCYKSELEPIQEFCTVLEKGFGILWGQTLNLHFKHNNQKHLYCNLLDKNLQLIYNFITEQVEKMYKLLITQPQTLTQAQRKIISLEGKTKFQDQLLKKIKQIKQIIRSNTKFIDYLDNQT